MVGPGPLVRIGVGDAPLAGERIAADLTAVADQAAEIGLVAQDAALAAIAVDQGREVPVGTGRCSDAIVVQALDDRLGRQAAGIFGEDPADHRRLLGVDLAHTVDGAPLLIDDAAHHPVAVRTRRDRIAGGGTGEQPAPDLRSQVAQGQGVHGALQPDVQLRHPALVRGVDLDPVMMEQVMHRRDVSQRARQAVEPLGDHEVDLPGFDRRDQQLKPRPGGGGAGHAGVREGLSVARVELELTGDQVAAERDLIVNRGWILDIGRVAGIDGNTYARFLEHRQRVFNERERCNRVESINLSTRLTL